MASGSSRKKKPKPKNRGAHKLWASANPVRIARTVNGAQTAQALAERAGISRKTINNLETGRHPPTYDVIHKIALALNKDPSKLLEEVEIWLAMRP